MTTPETSRTLGFGVRSREGLQQFVSHPVIQCANHADYLGFSLEDTTAVRITVGCKDEEISWILPKSLLTHDSKFFNAALNGTFAEANSGSIIMPEDNPEAFRVFVQWLYIGDIEIGDVDVWLEAWVLGDKIGNTVFRDCAMTKLVSDHSGLQIDPKTVAFAYRKSVRGSRLRKWALDEFLLDWSQELLYECAEDWVSVMETDSEFAADVAKSTISAAGNGFEDPRDYLDAYLEVFSVIHDQTTGCW